MKAEAIGKITVGVIAWATTVYGAYLYGGWGLAIMAISIPFMIHCW